MVGLIICPGDSLFFRLLAPAFRRRRAGGARLENFLHQMAAEIRAFERDGKRRAGELTGDGKRGGAAGRVGALFHDGTLAVIAGLSILSWKGAGQV